MVEVERTEGREVCAEFGEEAGPVDVFMTGGVLKPAHTDLRELILQRFCELVAKHTHD